MIALWHGVAGTYGDDKGNAKAQTIGLRTFLIQLFQIPAEDADHDPDARDPGDTGQQRRNGGSTCRLNDLLCALQQHNDGLCDLVIRDGDNLVDVLCD